ncbi:MAG: PAS domain S-box protein [Deltaproteobacteria bacterium]|nr:MAG: PAS domain S-box protein [Deltaproteobacteria bacterium]
MAGGEREPTPPSDETDGSSLRLLPPTDERAVRRRRIAYFMLFRLGVLLVCTALAAVVTWQRATDPAAVAPWEFWSALAVGYASAAYFARRLDRTSRLHRIAVAQTVFDLVLSTAVVQLSGGLLSGFSFLYLLTVLGAAVMGDRRLVLSTAILAGGVYVAFGLAQTIGVWRPLGTTGDSMPWRVAAAEILRTTAALGGVAALSAYLNTQLARSAEEAGHLRNLTGHILRSLDSGVLTATRRGRITYANPAAHAILGLDDLVGLELADVLAGLPSGFGPETRQEIDYMRPDGRRIRLGVACSPLRGENDEPIGVIVHFQDVTELEKMAERLRRSEQLAALGRLTGSAAHEIRNPLAAISGSAQLLARTATDDATRRLTETIRREAERLDHLVADMLAFGVPKPPDLVPIDVAAAVHEVAAMLGQDPLAHEVSITVDAADDLPRVDADPNQLSQVLWNLLRNAAEAAGPGGHVRIRVWAEGDGVGIEIVDDGPGFDGDPAQYFEPFATTKSGGSGFGLAIARRIVEDHSGRIEVDNLDAGGAVTRFWLPRVPSRGGAACRRPSRAPGLRR